MWQIAMNLNIIKSYRLEKIKGLIAFNCSTDSLIMLDLCGFGREIFLTLA
jgi:hypothetical protein